MKLSQSNVIFFCLFAAFVVFITLRGELPKYLAVLFTTQSSGSSASDGSGSGSGIGGAIGGIGSILGGIDSLTGSGSIGSSVTGILGGLKGMFK